MMTDFEYELRRIGEAPSPPGLNLWVSDQAPEELLEVLKRIPDRPADDGNGRDRAKVLDSEIPNPQNSNTGSASATVTTKQGNSTVVGRQVDKSVSDVDAVEAPHGPMYSKGNGWIWPRNQTYNSVYQRETGHIFADPGGDGDLIFVDGRIVSLRDEQEKEQRREIEGGGKDEGGKGGERWMMGILRRSEDRICDLAWLN